MRSWSAEGAERESQASSEEHLTMRSWSADGAKRESQAS